MGAPAARVSELSRLWANEGHEVTVLTGFPNHPTGIVPPEYRTKFRRLIAHDRSNDVDILRTWLLPLPNRKSYERVLNYGSFAASAALTGMFTSRPDVLIATSPQLLVGLSGWWIARCKRVPFVFEVRDLWPESLFAVGCSDNSHLYRALAAIAGFLYRASDHIVVVTDAFKEHLIEKWQIPTEKVSVVENGVDTELFRPRDTNPGARNPFKFVVSYIGTVGLAHGLETLVEAASKLQNSAPHVAFNIIGEGAEKEKIISIVHHKRLHNVQFIDQQPREKIPAHISASDACLVLLRGSEIFRTVLPTKMLEFMACGRPVIAAVDGFARDVLCQAHAGVAIEPQNSAELAQAIVSLAADPQRCAQYGSNGRRYILQNFTRERSARLYLDILSGLLQQNRSLAVVPA